MVVRGRLAFDDQGRLVEIAEDAQDPTNPQPDEIHPVEFAEIIADELSAASVSADEGQINNPDLPDDRVGSMNVSVEEGMGRAIVLQNLDDTVNNEEGRANIVWTTRDGPNGPERLAVVTSHPTHNHFSIYTKAGDVGDGNPKDLNKRLDIDGGGSGETSQSYFRNTSKLNVRNEVNSATIGVNAANGTNVSQFQWDSAGSARWTGRYDPSNGYLSFREFAVGSGRVLTLHDDGRISGEQSPTEDWVWQSGSTRPSSPVEGQRFFDSDLEQPIWYDGSDWVDATGSVV